MWFRNLFGFDEESPEQVRENIEVDGQLMVSKVNKARYQCGSLEICSLAELRRALSGFGAIAADDGERRLVVEQIVGDIRDVHCDPRNDGCVIQVASQFNALEMVGPGVSPREGIAFYCNDPTQGPKCALACPGGTVFRTSLVNGAGQGETQIDLLADVGKVLGNRYECYWAMQKATPCPKT